MIKQALFAGMFLFLSIFTVSATNNSIESVVDTNKIETPAPTPPKKWYDKISLRGYAQVRYNRLLETNPALKCEQCDKSWGDKGGFFIRRARLIFSGNLSDRVFFYIQPDLASNISSSVAAQNFAQIRDLYFDVALDTKKEFRFRIGQSKIPYGFENLQSSQNRLALDRNDPLNSALPNERDLGVMFYWAPDKIRHRFATLVSSGLKGSGDYGVFGIGAYNGQTANRLDENNKPHIVARLSYPFELKNKQIIEAGIQAYTGEYVVTALSTGFKPETTKFLDSRVAASLIVYPKPFGLSVEYNIGKGPEFDPTTKTIQLKDLKGGYAQLNYYYKYADKKVLIPFVRYQHYQGGKKAETDARSYLVTDVEIGTEWQALENFELTAIYTISNRTTRDFLAPQNAQKGNLLRLQAQLNF
jgi:phosphate-selective porin